MSGYSTYYDRLECFVAQTPAITLLRVHAKSGGRARRIDHHHIVHSLAANPQPFGFARLRDDLLPSEAYRQLRSVADAQFDPRTACKGMVTLRRRDGDLAGMALSPMGWRAPC